MVREYGEKVILIMTQTWEPLAQNNVSLAKGNPSQSNVDIDSFNR